MTRAAVGFRVKSGWATAVLLAGPATAPRVADRTILQLADPSVPESSQPYHAALDLPKGKGAKAVARLVKVVERHAGRSVADLIRRYRDEGYRILGAGIVVGSGIDPLTIKNDHIRAHAEEGRLFRRVIENGVKRCRVRSSVTVERELFARGSRRLGRPEGRLKEEIAALGRGVGGRWRAEEKTATLAAWMLLA